MSQQRNARDSCIFMRRKHEIKTTTKEWKKLFRGRGGRGGGEWGGLEGEDMDRGRLSRKGKAQEEERARKMEVGQRKSRDTTSLRQEVKVGPSLDGIEE